MEPSSYQERPSTVPDAVLWQRSGHGSAQVLPDGCMDLLLTESGIVIAGPDTEPYAIDDSDGRRYVGLRFAPGRLPVLLDLKASEVRNQRVPLTDVLGAAKASRLEDALIAADRPGRSLERYALLLHAGQRRDHDHDRLLGTVTSMIAAGTPIGTIARETGLGERRLHRLGLQYFGYGPKLLGRILRLQRALQLRADDVSAAEVAALAGYADQAHLIRDTKQLAGHTFGHFAG